MNSSFTGHMDDEQLLRLLDGELEASELAAVRSHIEACWSCRARLRQMEDAITSLVAWRNRELSAQEAPPAGGRQRLARALERQETERPERRFPGLLRGAGAWQTVWTANRSRYISAAVAASIVVLLILLPLAEPPRITAAVFLERAKLARPAQGRSVIRERIEVRYGRRVLQRDFTIRPGSNPTIVGASLAGSASMLPEFEDGPISWMDPMSVEAFERWHDRLEKRSDSIHETPDSITLRTEAGQDRIVAASLIVRRSDWRPIAKQIEFVSEPGLEVRQISYEISPSEPEADPVMTAATNAPHTRPPQEPLEMVMERTEIAVREALYRVAADRNEIPEIGRGAGLVRVKAIAETEERRRELLEVLQSIPHVQAEIQAATPVSAQAVEAASVLPAATHQHVYSTTPPLAKELWEYLHGMDEANRRLTAVRESYFAVLPPAKALQRLAERYDEAALEAMPGEVRARVNQLAASYIGRIREAGTGYLEGVSDPLNEMLRRKPVSGVPTPQGASCRSWQQLSSAVVGDLEQLHTTFRRLFVVEETEQPVTLSGEELLADAARLRGRLRGALAEFCAGRDRGSRPDGVCEACP
ncbi:MAG: hypothetical protein QM757_09600 [Paludibaculum sp.]